MLALSHLSALRVLASLSLHEDLSDLPRRQLPKTYKAVIPDDIDSLARRYDLEFPLDIIDTKSKSHPSSKIMRHTSSTASHASSFIELEGTDLLCTAPELCFVQLCGRLDLLDASRLLAWMGGTYGVQPCGGLVKRNALVTRASFCRRLERLGSLHGVKLARRAVRHMPLGSASPIESLVSVAFSLPLAVGGCGLRGMEINAAVELGQREWLAVGATKIRPDFLWRAPHGGQSLAVEYDSDAFHTGAERIEFDALRRNTLTNQGLVVLTLTRKQLFDFEAYELFASQLRGYLGYEDHRPWDLRQRERRQLHRRLFLSKAPQSLLDIGFGQFWK